MARRIMVGIPVAVIFLTVVGINSYGQNDTTWILNRKGEEARFSFGKVHNPNEMNLYTADRFPVYVLTAKQHKRIMGILQRYLEMESDYDQWRRNKLSTDSLWQERENATKQIVEAANGRAANFEDSFKKLLLMNQQLDLSLQHCETIAHREHRRAGRKIFLTGIVAGLVGFVIGNAL